MNKLLSRDDLSDIRAKAQERIRNIRCRILICAGTGCLAGGSLKIYEKLCELCGKDPDAEIVFGPEVAHTADKTDIQKSGCHGFCEMGPLVRIEPYNYLYIKVKPEDCDEIYNTTVLGGHIGAEHIEEALAFDGYRALEKVLFTMTPEDVVNVIYDSNLRGRGGGGFQTGYKWKQVARQPEKKRYIVCNGDEGDPGAFMDRSVMEGDPHKMIEGMLIAAYAVGSTEGYQASYQ